MDIEIFRTFLEVERLRHFGHAAKELFVTQAAISSRIKLLEETLGVKLFIRQTRQIDLTPEGHRFKRYAERFVVEWRKARHDVNLGKEDSQLTFGGTSRVWGAGLQEWLHKVHREFPQIALIVESHAPEVLVRRLLDGQLDVGFILEPPQIDVLEIVEVAQLQLVMVTNKPKMAVEDALGPGFIAVDWGLGQALQHRRLYPDAHEPSMRMSQAGVAFDFIMEFGGAAYLSTRQVFEEIKQGKLFPVQNAPIIERIVHAMYPVRSERLEQIEQVLALFDYSVALPRRRKVVS